MASYLNLDSDLGAFEPELGALDFLEEIPELVEALPSTSDPLENILDFVVRTDGNETALHGLQAPQAKQPVRGVNPTRPARQRVRSKEGNRRNQRDYRAKKKTELQRLQAELAEMQRAMQRMQSAGQHAPGNQLVLAQRAYAQASHMRSVPHLPWQEPEVVDSRLLNRIMPAWRAGKILTCSLTEDQASVVQQVACLAPQQLVILWQRQVKEMAGLLRSAGQALGGPAGCRVQGLIDEYCCTNFVKARADPLGHKALMANASYTPNPLAVAHAMQFTPSQKRAIFCLRRSYLQQLAHSCRRRQQLLQQLQTAPEATGINGSELASCHLTVDDITGQLQGLMAEEHTAYMVYLRTVGHEISSVWQAAVSIVHSYPHTTDLIASVDALAEEEGEPLGEAFSIPDAFADDTANSQDLVGPSSLAGQMAHEPQAAQTSTSHSVTGAQLPSNTSEKTDSSGMAVKALCVVSSLVKEDLTPGSIFGSSVLPPSIDVSQVPR